MPAESVFKRFCLKDADFLICIVCERRGIEKKYSKKGGISNFGRHVRREHRKELAAAKMRKAKIQAQRDGESELLEQSELYLATSSKSSRGSNRLMRNVSLSASPTKVPTPSRLRPSNSHARPATIEQLTAQQNKLLTQIVSQNQKMLTKTTKTNQLLRQNQQLMKIVIKEHLKISPEELELNLSAEEDDDEEQGEDKLDNDCQFESNDEDGEFSGLENLIVFKTGPGNIEEVAEENMDVEDTLNISSPENPTTRKRRLLEAKENGRNRLMQRLPIISVDELKAIDKEIQEDSIFKEVVVDFIRKVKVRGTDLTQLVETSLLEHIANDDERDQSFFIAEVEKPLPRRNL